jgi:hypothetical protein
MIFMLRIAVLVIIMVYFSVSLSLPRLIEDNQFLMTLPVFKSMIFFAVATLLFIRNLMVYYQTLDINSERKSTKVASLIPTLINAIVINWQLRNNIEADTSALISETYSIQPFVSKSNLLGCMFITYLVLILSV